MKVKNAAELDKKYAKPFDSIELAKDQTGAESFPKYDEYEVMPGKPKNSKE